MAKSNDELQREILEVELETRRLNLERAREDNTSYLERKKMLVRQREQMQLTSQANAKKASALQAFCNHRQGASPDNIYEGTGPSCLTRSRIFFSGNYLIQCVWCGLKLQRPHPAMKNRKPRPGETAEQRDQRVKKYEADLAYYNKLLAESRGNKLPPMEGPTWEFTDADGIPVMPEPR
jgi:hypothetical protein